MDDLYTDKKLRGLYDGIQTGFVTILAQLSDTGAKATNGTAAAIAEHRHAVAGQVQVLQDQLEFLLEGTKEHAAISIRESFASRVRPRAERDQAATHLS